MAGFLFPAVPLRWFIPPFAGALIGFITNVIAIKMLFRPLKEIRVFGLRLPFTPGILPRERHALALNIGAMTEKHLLTEDLIRKRLDDAGFRGPMLNLVSLASGRLFSSHLKENSWFNSEKETPSDAARFLARLVRAALDSPLLDAAALSLCAAFLEKSKGKTLRAALGEERSSLLVKKLAALASAGLGSGAFSSAIAALFGRQYPSVVRSFIDLLRDKEVHDELETQGRIFLSATILKLNAVQRFFISAGQYDRTLNERMGEIVDDFINRLEKGLNDELTQEKAAAFLCARAPEFIGNNSEGSGAFLEAPLAAFLDTDSGEVLALLLRFFSPAPGEKSGTALEGEEVAGFLSTLLRRKAGDETGMALALDAFLRGHGEDNLAGLFGLDEKKKAAIDKCIAGALLGGIRERAKTILASLDIKTIVAEKIDSLDMLEVEKMVLGIMADKFKWIDIFGAILGGLIGLVQVLLGRFSL
ncbi:MAG: DUF445 family protein [Spirochaetaceae bacterium]|jgi:uncharacterized membrane-anchored protein YjiN (DUF445 family)|nr:DUF445 family protein [Spirochaetaceae bacterium]